MLNGLVHVHARVHIVQEDSNANDHAQDHFETAMHWKVSDFSFLAWRADASKVLGVPVRPRG